MYEKIKAEIERQLSAHDKVDHLESFEVGKAWNRGHRKALENLLSFIGSLEAEHKDLGEDMNIVFEAISSVCNTSKPEEFARHNETVYKVAMMAVSIAQGRESLEKELPQGLGEAAEMYKIGDKIRIKGSGAKGDIITNVYTSSEGRFYEFENSDDQPTNLNWELVKTDVEIAAEEYTKDDTLKPWRNLCKSAFKAGAK